MVQHKLKKVTRLHIEFFAVALNQRLKALQLALEAAPTDLNYFKSSITEELRQYFFKKAANILIEGKKDKTHSITLKNHEARVLIDACVFFEDGTLHQKAIAERYKQLLMPVLL